MLCSASLALLLLVNRFPLVGNIYPKLSGFRFELVNLLLLILLCDIVYDQVGHSFTAKKTHTKYGD